MNTESPITKREALNRFLAHMEEGKDARQYPKPIVVLDPEVIEAINQLAEKQGISQVQALKKAVITGTFLYNLTSEKKGRLLIENPDKSVSQITLK